MARKPRPLSDATIRVIEVMRELGGRATSGQVAERLKGEVNIVSRMQMLHDRGITYAVGSFKSTIPGARAFVIWELDEEKADEVLALGVASNKPLIRFRANQEDIFLQMCHILAGKPLGGKK
jgi:hypothetical protein